MLLGINLLLLLKVNAARHNLLLLVAVNAVEGKTINEEVQLQGLVDGKKIIITESTVRRDLQLQDAERVDCLPNATIFEQLALMGMVKNLDNVSGKFLMYPRFVQVFLNQQLDDMSTHKRLYIAPSYTKKIFGNMRRVGKGFSGRVTPLFPTMVVQNQQELGEGSTMPTDPQHTPTIIQPSTSQPQKTHKPRKPKRKATQVPQPSGPTDIVIDEAVYKERDDSLVRVATTASNLEAEQDSGNINKTQSKATPNESSSQGADSGGGPRCQETMGDTIAQTSLKLEELMEICTNLQRRVLALEETKTTQAAEIVVQSWSTARVDLSDEEESLDEDASKQGMKIDDIDADIDVTLVNDVVNDEDINSADEEMTLAQTLIEIKSTKPKAKGIVMLEPSKSTSTISLQQPSKVKGQGSKDKGKEKMIEPEPIDVDYQLAEQLQAKEQEELTIEEKSTLFKELLETRRKHFAAKRAEEKRNKPPTKAQQIKITCNYLKNMEGYKLKDLKLKEFDSIKEMFDKALKRVNTFEDFRTELVEGSSKIAGTELIQAITKKSKVAIDAIPLAVKSPKIVDWKIYKEGRKSYFQIIRVDGKSQIYRIFSQMLKSFDREDLEDLYKLVKAKYESTRPVEDLDLLLWGDLKTMFEPHVEDQSVQIYMLVEKKYPLTPLTLSLMLEKKLIIEYESEMAYQLVKLSRNNLRSKYVFGSILLVINEAFNEET
ncbi:hypothetical protein Tco_0282242 [Tanacetum coccineum]